MQQHRNRALLGLTLLVAAASPACNAGPLVVTPPATVKLKVGSGASIAGTPWTVRFDSVVSDSRCPIGVFCIQAGEALLALELASPLADPLPQDNPHFALGTSPVTIEGLTFTQLDVSPLMRLNPPIDPASYVVTLRIDGTSVQD